VFRQHRLKAQISIVIKICHECGQIFPRSFFRYRIDIEKKVGNANSL
jgi:hypothetical protein